MHRVEASFAAIRVINKVDGIVVMTFTESPGEVKTLTHLPECHVISHVCASN